MLNEIEKKFGKNLLLGLGDWSINSSYQMKGCMPTHFIKVINETNMISR